MTDWAITEGDRIPADDRAGMRRSEPLIKIGEAADTVLLQFQHLFSKKTRRRFKSEQASKIIKSSFRLGSERNLLGFVAKVKLLLEQSLLGRQLPLWRVAYALSREFARAPPPVIAVS